MKARDFRVRLTASTEAQCIAFMITLLSSYGYNTERVLQVVGRYFGFRVERL